MEKLKDGLWDCERISSAIKKRVRQRIFRYKWRERKVQFGKSNPEKTFYVIRWAQPSNALSGLVALVLGRIHLAEKNGWIPVVDFQNGPNYYLEDELVGKENSWEYYFCQPGNIALSEVYNSKNVILAFPEVLEYRPLPNKSFFENENGQLDFWLSTAKKYLQFTPQMQGKIEYRKKQIFPYGNGRNIIGVKCRGTDYNTLHPQGHPIQPSIEMIFNKIDEVFGHKKYTHIFLSCEDQNMCEQFQQKYGDKLLLSEKPFENYKGGWLTPQYSTRRLDGEEYLCTLSLLSQCEYMLGGANGGALLATLLRGSRENTFFWNLGIYS